MIEILPLRDENELEKYCSEHNISNTSAVMTAKDGSEELGSVAAVIEDKILVITVLETDNEWMKDSLIRAILAYADNRFIMDAKTYLTDSAFNKVGFKENGDFLEIKISNVIHNCRG